MAGAPALDGSTDLRPDALVGGKYRIEEKLGEGGMGAVYAARHQHLGSRIALKILLPAIAKDPQVVGRFLQEARAAARIEGDHVARVFDVGTHDDGRPFMVMELLAGEDLSAKMARGAIAPGVAVAYVVQALQGISEAHEIGVVHRDLKPENVFVTQRTGRQDTVKILDFGISKASFEQSANITRTGSTMGSPAYMSPEQVRSSKDVDRRADIWSTGVILYELLTGKLPFHAETVGGVFAAILETRPPPPAGVPEGLSRAVMRCLERDPAKRFQSADELTRALAPYADAMPTTTTLAQDTAETRAATVASETHATWGKEPKTAANRPRVVRTVLVLALLATGVGAFALMRTRTQSTEEPSVSAEPVVASPATTPSAIDVPPAASPIPIQSVAPPPPSSVARPRRPTPLPLPQPQPSASSNRDIFQRH
ncbi:MAG TPA: protein kinase [Polyangiaceae bacterium]|nr:protein kinase [Polyangiaceae bacterium]